MLPLWVSNRFQPKDFSLCSVAFWICSVTNQRMLLSRRKFQRGVIQAFNKVSKAGNIYFIFNSLKERCMLIVY